MAKNSQHVRMFLIYSVWLTSFKYAYYNYKYSDYDYKFISNIRNFKKMKLGKVIREHKKLAEECMELALIITQQLNKPKMDFEDDIIDEIGDVKWRLKLVEKYYDSKRIEERINYKKDRELEKK